MQPLVVAITGASGAIYGIRLLEVLLGAGRNVYLSISPSGQAVLETELGVKVDLSDFAPTQLVSKARAASEAIVKQSGKIHYCHYQD